MLINVGEYVTWPLADGALMVGRVQFAGRTELQVERVDGGTCRIYSDSVIRLATADDRLSACDYFAAFKV